MKWIRWGLNREVFLTKRYAIKIPKWRYGWRYFLEGMINNLNEASWWKNGKDERLCPVVLSAFAGLVLVMKRCDPLPENTVIDYERFACLPTDNKPDNFGMLNGRIVKLDYGSR